MNSKMSLRGIIIIVALMLSADGSAFGETLTANSKASAIDELSTFVSQPQSEYSAAFRKQFIQTFASYCQQVLDALPANTPAEDAWVVSQQKTPDQIGRLLQSNEYSRHYLKNAFLDCKDTTAKLSQIQNLTEKEKRAQPEAYASLEAGQFVKLALNFNDGFEPYLPKVELYRDVKFGLSDIYVGLVRRGLLIAATKALQDVP
jgi:hypothetical protein